MLFKNYCGYLKSAAVVRPTKICWLICFTIWAIIIKGATTRKSKTSELVELQDLIYTNSAPQR